MKVYFYKALYFDGHRDSTAVQEKKYSKYYCKIVKVEHMVLVQDPGSKYIVHVSPTSNSAKTITSHFLDFIKKNSIVTSHLVAVGCDRTVVIDPQLH